MKLINKIDNQEVKVGGKISGGRLDKYYAIVEKIYLNYILVHYNGECRSVELRRENLNRMDLDLVTD